MKNRSRACLSIFFAFFLTACASTTTYKVEPQPGFHYNQLHKIMVLSMSKTPEVRRSVENEFVKGLKKHGADAFASIDILPASLPIDKPHVASVAKAQRFDSVLVSRLVGVQKIDPNIRNEQFDVAESTADAALRQEFSALVASPQYASEYQLAVVTASVYSVATESKVWSVTTQTFVNDEVPTHIREYVGVVLKNFYK